MTHVRTVLALLVVMALTSCQAGIGGVDPIALGKTLLVRDETTEANSLRLAVTMVGKDHGEVQMSFKDNFTGGHLEMTVEDARGNVLKNVTAEAKTGATIIQFPTVFVPRNTSRTISIRAIGLEIDQLTKGFTYKPVGER